MSDDTLLTVDEVAERLGVSRATVYRNVNSGSLPAIKLDRAIRIPSSALVPTQEDRGLYVRPVKARTRPVGASDPYVRRLRGDA